MTVPAPQVVPMSAAEAAATPQVSIRPARPKAKNQTGSSSSPTPTTLSRIAERAKAAMAGAVTVTAATIARAQATERRAEAMPVAVPLRATTWGSDTTASASVAARARRLTPERSPSGAPLPASRPIASLPALASRAKP